MEEYIGDSWRNVLKLHLKAIQKARFEEETEDQRKLHVFILESFKIVLHFEQERDSTKPADKIKTLEHLTLNIGVPSAHDIVNNLDLEKLLK